MPSKKAIKRRITSVTSIEHIMKAMDMVSASKFQRAKARLRVARRLYEETKRIMESLEKHGDYLAESIYFKHRPVKNTAYLVIVGDKGLCGGYNTNVMETALSHMNAGNQEKIIVVGGKGWEYFYTRRKKNIGRDDLYTGLPENKYYECSQEIARRLMEWYATGEVDEAYLVYTRFESSLTFAPRIMKILPLGEEGQTYSAFYGMKYGPDAEAFTEQAVPVYVNTLIYAAMVESVTCEHCARMTSMNSASNNAGEVIEKLTRMYNRKRQAAITQEISEIVNSTNMMK